MSSNSRVYAKIDLDAVEYNLQSMRDNLKKGTKMCGKGDIRPCVSGQRNRQNP